MGSGDRCVRGRLSCIGLGDRGLSLIPGKRQHGRLGSLSEEAGEEASDWESRRKTEGQRWSPDQDSQVGEDGPLLIPGQPWSTLLRACSWHPDTLQTPDGSEIN